MLLICPGKNTYTWPQAPAKIRPFPSCPRGDSGDKGKSKGREKKHARLDFPLPPLSAPGYARMFLFGERVKKSRGERRERVRACRQTFFKVIYGGSNGCNCLRAKIFENKGRINMNSCSVKVTLKVKNLIFFIRASNNIYFSNLYFNIA